MTVAQGDSYGELYDLQNDPHEMDNLFEDAAHRGVRAELMEKLAYCQMELADLCRWAELERHHRGAVGRVRVKMRKARSEHMSSGFLPTAHIGQSERHFAFVPGAVIPNKLAA
jgi:hypothetical protein